MQLLQHQAGHLNHSKAASRCVIRKNKAVQNKPLNTLRSPPLPQRLHVSTTVLVIGALHLPSLHLPSLHLTSLLTRQQGGSAPSVLLRCSPCFASHDVASQKPSSEHCRASVLRCRPLGGRHTL